MDPADSGSGTLLKAESMSKFLGYTLLFSSCACMRGEASQFGEPPGFRIPGDICGDLSLCRYLRERKYMQVQLDQLTNKT